MYPDHVSAIRGSGTDAEPQLLTALAPGCVAVLPYRFAETFGDNAAVYCAPDEVAEAVRTWHGRRATLREQSDRGPAFVRRQHPPELYAERIATLIG
jgi:hypothetical protein